MRTAKYFAAYAAMLGAAFALVALCVHVLIAHEYANALEARLTILAGSGAEAVENRRPGKSIDDALSDAVGSSDEGLVWFDARGKPTGSSGNTSIRGAFIKRLAIQEEGTDGSIQATISGDRLAIALRDLDRGLALGIILIATLGGLIVAVISTRAVERVELAYQRVHRFTADAAHELRTPLAAITSNAEALAVDTGDAALRGERLATIRQAAFQMRELMNGLLILARADEDITLDLHAIDVPECVERVVESFQREARERDIELNVTVHMPATMYGRPEQVARIVGNLIENALRYTPAGGSIDVNCTAVRNAAVIEVRDTGSGIAAGDIKRIFDRFWRAGGATTTGGSGLGLSIAQSLARSHGGSIRVASVPNQGSTFTVRLPLRPRRHSALSTFS